VNSDHTAHESTFHELVAELVAKGAPCDEIRVDGGELSGWVIGSDSKIVDEWYGLGHYREYIEHAQLAALDDGTLLEYGTWSDNESGRKSSGEFSYRSSGVAGLRHDYRGYGERQPGRAMTYDEIVLRLKARLPRP
jgi:hypothetical protein